MDNTDDYINALLRCADLEFQLNGLVSTSTSARLLEAGVDISEIEMLVEEI